MGDRLRTRGVRRLALIALATLVGAAVPASGSARAAPKTDVEVRIRRNVDDLSAAERTEFVDAVVALKTTPSPYDEGLSWYDQFVAWHSSLTRCEAIDLQVRRQQRGHAGPMFLPWHRQFLLLFEDALRAVSGTDVTVPYWDWTDPAATAAVFADDFMGGSGDPAQGYAVTTGPFRRGAWDLLVRNSGPVYGTQATNHLVRHLGGFPGVPLPTSADVSAALAAQRYDSFPFDDTTTPASSIRNALEGWRSPASLSETICLPTNELVTLPAGGLELHNAVHVWVGGITGTASGAPLLGTMAVPQASPNDPVFFLHHANIDRLWSAWQASHATAAYLPAVSTSGNGSTDLVEPFSTAGHPATPNTLADITVLGYKYDSAPEPDVHNSATLPDLAFSDFCMLPPP